MAALLGPQIPLLQSVGWDERNHKLMVAFWSSELHEVHDAEGYDLHDGPVLTGHHSHRLFGICANPANPAEFATAGEDKSVRLWDTRTHRCVCVVQLDTMAHAVTWSPKGDLLAVGLGYQSDPPGFGPGARRQRKDGAFLILSRKLPKPGALGSLGGGILSVAHEGRDSKAPVTCLGFDPSGRTLAVGSEDSVVYLYVKDRSAGGWVAAGRCRGHKGPVRRLDFSVKGDLLQSFDGEGYLKFWEASGHSAGEEVRKSSDPDALWATIKDTKWATTTCPGGWAVQSGCAGQFDDGCVVSCTARSHDAADLGTNLLLATVDNFSRLRLWRYPCAAPNPNFAEYRAHGGGGISAVCFSHDDRFVFSCGEQDCCIMQWRLSTEGAAPLGEACTEDILIGPQVHDLKDGKDFARLPDAEAACVDDRLKIFFAEERAADDDFAPVKQWQRQALAPSRPPPERLDEPLGSLRLSWMHGFRAGDVRGGVAYARPWGLHPDSAAELAARQGTSKEKLVIFFGGATSAVLDSTAKVRCVPLDARTPILHTGDERTNVFIKTSNRLIDIPRSAPPPNFFYLFLFFFFLFSLSSVGEGDGISS